MRPWQRQARRRLINPTRNRGRRFWLEKKGYLRWLLRFIRCTCFASQTTCPTAPSPGQPAVDRVHLFAAAARKGTRHSAPPTFRSFWGREGKGAENEKQQNFPPFLSRNRSRCGDEEGDRSMFSDNVLARKRSSGRKMDQSPPGRELLHSGEWNILP